VCNSRIGMQSAIVLSEKWGSLKKNFRGRSLSSPILPVRAGGGLYGTE
jgi:hypothetical protein